MSRFALPETVIDEVARCETFTSQILFSTSISTLDKWDVFEKGSDPPLERLATLTAFALRGVAANVMIKPFLPGVTDVESEKIANAIQAAGVKYCVVGSLHWNGEILRTLNSIDDESARGLVRAAEHEQHGQILDCSSDDRMSSFTSLTLDNFIEKLKLHGLSVFKKSACVNSHLLQEKNAVLLFENDLERLCVHCGVCEN